MFVAILSIAMLLALAAFGLALRSMLRGGRWRDRVPWLVIAMASLLLAVRRAITLSQFISQGLPQDIGLGPEIVSLAVSALVLAGVSWLGSVFHQLEESNRALTRVTDERGHIEGALAESEQRFRMLFEFAPDAYYLNDEQGMFIDGNRRAEEITGYSRQELIGKSFLEIGILPPEQLPKAAELLLRNAAGESTGPDEFTLLRKDSTLVEVEIMSHPVQFGEQRNILGIARDITARKSVEQALRSSEELYHTITEEALVGVYLFQGQVFRYVNPAMANIYGYEREEIVGKLGLIDLAHTDDRALVAENIQRRLDGEVKSVRYEMQGVRKDGTIIHCEALGTCVEYQGEPAILGTLVDISERKRHEREMALQLERMTALREIDLAITGSLDPRLTFNVLLRHVTQRLGVDAASILVFDKHSQRLKFAAGTGFRTEALQYTGLKMGEGYAGRAALQREVVHIPDLSAEENSLRKSPLLPDEGFVSYLAIPLIAKGVVRGVLELLHRSPLDVTQSWLDFLWILAGQAAIAMDNAVLFDELNQSNVDLMRAYDNTLEGWALALEYRDLETEGHSQRVTELTLRMARQMGIREAELPHVRRGALLHDVGKMGIPDAILLKPGPLSEDEWEIMRKHPGYAYEMLKHIDYLKPALDIPYCHHEHWDGSGYPRGLKGEEVPLTARIFAIVDVWDALLSDRPYRKAWPEEKVLAYLEDEAGKHFDPKVVQAFLAMKPNHASSSFI
jgi:PAS domain S-box-containing protein